jgi:hypothetical protein
MLPANYYFFLAETKLKGEGKRGFAHDLVDFNPACY